jgi:probable DNA metabolism protein
MRVVTLADETDFGGWRAAARRLIIDGIAPEDVSWSVGIADHLFAGTEDAIDAPGSQPAAAFTVPRGFLEQCATVILHRDTDRFAFLYRLLWRLRREPGLVAIAVDPDIVRLEAMVKAIRHDLHKTKAYVRFREVAVPQSNGSNPRPSQIERALRDGDHRGVLEPWYVAWFEPSHHIVEAVAPFFARRFTAMRWAILTPDRSASWDGETLSFGPGAQRGDAPDNDALEDLWRSYYANIFNPARLKLKTMQGHMPKKYWKNLPEAELIAPLAAAAQQRTQTMIDASPLPAPARTERVMQAARHRTSERIATYGAAEMTESSNIDPATIEPAFEPSLDLAKLARAAHDCRACPLWEPATQTVFGEGSAHARIVVVGEQPGDQEDIAGKPFVGPAGQLFDRALKEAGIDRKTMYVTNAVKHFKFIVRGKRRMHQTPKVTEVRSCRPWLDAEIARLKPDLVIAMGATAAQSVFGRATPVEKSRRQFFEHTIGGHPTRVVVTVHPSYLLRLPDEDAKAAAYENFVEDLRVAHQSI